MHKLNLDIYFEEFDDLITYCRSFVSQIPKENTNWCIFVKELSSKDRRTK